MTPTETYFADSELPMTMSLVGDGSTGHWALEVKWRDTDNRPYGQVAMLDTRPNRKVRKLLHKTFLKDYKFWLEHRLKGG